MKKRLPGAPHEVLLVLDASTGQNGRSKSHSFPLLWRWPELCLRTWWHGKGGIVLAISKKWIAGKIYGVEKASTPSPSIAVLLSMRFRGVRCRQLTRLCLLKFTYWLLNIQTKLLREVVQRAASVVKDWLRTRSMPWQTRISIMLRCRKVLIQVADNGEGMSNRTLLSVSKTCNKQNSFCRD